MLKFKWAPFADGEGAAAGGAPAGGEGGAPKDGGAPEGAKTLTQDEVNRVVAQRLSEERGKWEAAAAAKEQEAQRLAKLTADEQAAEKLRLAEEKAAALEKEKSAILLKQDTVSELAKRKLDTAFADTLIGENAEKTKANIDAFEKAFKAAVEAAVTEKLKGKTPSAGGSGAGGTGTAASFVELIKQNQAKRR